MDVQLSGLLIAATHLDDRGAAGATSGVTSASVGLDPTAGAALLGAVQDSRAVEAVRAAANSLLVNSGPGATARLLTWAPGCWSMPSFPHAEPFLPNFRPLSPCSKRLCVQILISAQSAVM